MGWNSSVTGLPPNVQLQIPFYSFRRAQLILYMCTWRLRFVGVPLPGTGAWTGAMATVLRCFPSHADLGFIDADACPARSHMSFVRSLICLVWAWVRHDLCTSTTLEDACEQSHTYFQNHSRSIDSCARLRLAQTLDRCIICANVCVIVCYCTTAPKPKEGMSPNQCHPSWRYLSLYRDMQINVTWFFSHQTCFEPIGAWLGNAPEIKRNKYKCGTCQMGTSKSVLSGRIHHVSPRFFFLDYVMGKINRRNLQRNMKNCATHIGRNLYNKMMFYFEWGWPIPSDCGI
jgi:hypothetical protein